MRFSERDMANAVAAVQNIGRMWQSADQRLAIRRAAEWADTGVAAVASGEGRASGHSDPTPRRALHPHRTPDVDLLLRQWLDLSLKVERALPALIRPTTPTKLEAEATDVAFDSDAVFRPRSGNCEICDEYQPGGDLDSQKLHQVEGHGLCATHKRGRYKRNNRHRTIANYIDSMRAMLGRDPK